MQNIKKYFITILGFFVILTSCGKKNIIKNDSLKTDTNITNSKITESKAIDLLNTGKEITFDKVKYNLIFSSKPSDTYYKQEYLQEKDTLEKYNRLILLEVITGNLNLKDAVSDKVNELKKRKETDPMVNYNLFEKKGEVMLDFLVSENLSDRKNIEVLERNVYRYKPLKDNNGQDGVLLFGVSERTYGEDIDRYLLSLKEKRFALPEAAGSFVIPKIMISNSN